MSLSRRDFLKYAAFAAAGTGTNLAEGGFIGSALAMGSRPPDKIEYIPTYCEMCFWNCGAVAKVVNGRVEKLDGHPYHPRSRGKLCARGNGGMGQLYDPDRLKYPMIRTGQRGDGKYRKATWDEALDYVAEKMMKIKDEHGAESMAFLMHGGITKHLMNLRAAFGSPNFAFPSFAQCRGARVVGYELTYGEDVGSPERVDLGNSRVMAFFGTHLGENMHNSQVQDFSDALGSGAKLIVVDPRFSTAAGKADYWLPIKPGTDMALMLAWTNIIISEDWYDRDYVQKYTIGFDELREAVKEYTPEWAAKETEIPANLIVETARELGRYAPAVCVHPGRFTAWHGNDTQRTRAIAILGAILGTWGRKGGIYLHTKAGLPGLEGKAYPKPARPSLTGGPYPFSKTQLVIEVRNATITGEPYPVKGWFVAGTNLMKSIPDQRKTREAIEKLDLLVGVDIMPSETMMMADVILPECTYLERHDELQISRDRSLTLSIRQPAVKPMYESREGWWIINELARRLGLSEYFPYETYEVAIKKQCEVMKIDYENLKKKGTIIFENSSDPYITESNEPVFNTPSGKIELYSKSLEKAGFDPIPRYKPVAQPEEGWFRLLFGRSPVHTLAGSMNNQRLWELFRENSVWINKKAASKLGIRDGQYVTVINQDGVKSNRVRAKVTERIRKDCVFMVHGFGSESEGLSKAYKRGADDQGLITRFNIDPISGSSGMRVNFVKIEAWV